MKIERKEIRFKADSIDLEANTFEGHPSVFNVVDEGRDKVVPGAFSNTLKAYQGLVKIFRDHFDLIGKPIDMKEDLVGLWAKAQISLTTLGQDTMILMRDGALDALSIGFEVLQEERDRKNNIRILKELKLWEFSVVTWGMNMEARVEAVKSRGRFHSDIKQILNTDEMKRMIQSLALQAKAEPPRNNRIDPAHVQSLRDEMKLFKTAF